MNEIITAVMWFLLLGGILGVALSFAAKFLSVKEDPRIEKIMNKLPNANCGGCGKAGCAAMAECIAEGKAFPKDCTVADDICIEEISEIMGIKSEKKERLCAHVMCVGTNNSARKKYIYEGIPDCSAAEKLFGGEKICISGCLGLGTCISACKFGALKTVDGCAVVDRELCRGCGACVAVCPRKIIKLLPYESVFAVSCSDKEKGAVTKKYCDAGCLGCKLCEKNCDVSAIKAEGGLALIDYAKCNNCGKCAEVCPSGIIRRIDGKYTVLKTVL